MKWWVFILLPPFNLLAQETYNDCIKIPPQTYEVNFDADKEYHWWVSNGNIVVNNGNSVTIQWPDSVGVYTISVSTTRFSCVGDTSYYEVFVEACPHPQLLFPNSFSPNADGVNDFYQVLGKSADDISYISIYNRWGERIFEANGNVPWDGKRHWVNGGNRFYPQGMYILTVHINDDKFIKYLTLVR